MLLRATFPSAEIERERGVIQEEIRMYEDQPSQLAQDVASACRTVLGEVYYDTTLGVDYFGQLFGQTPPASVFQEQFVNAATSVAGVVSASCTIESYAASTRAVVGQVTFTDVNNNTQTVSF